MAGFRNFFENLDDIFGASTKHRIVSKDPPKTTAYILKLYRGFNFDWNELERDGNYYVLSPERSEQGMLWFTHELVRCYNPIEYAASHGEYFLTYHLKCQRHISVIHWDDGSTSHQIPDEIMAQQNPTENCRFFAGYELPEGWVFTYKTEKFIGCSHKIRITKEMIRKSSEVLVDYE